MALLCTLAQVKAALGLPDTQTAEDARLSGLIGIASVQIGDWCECDFEPVDVVDELRDGDGTDLLLLARTPIISVSALAIDGQVVDVSEVKVYPYYIRFDGGGEYNPRLRSASRIFPEGRQNIRVSYRAGYAEVPAKISDAAVVQTIVLLNTLSKKGLLSETNAVAQATTAYSQVPLDPMVRMACNRFRRPKAAVV